MFGSTGDLVGPLSPLRGRPRAVATWLRGVRRVVRLAPRGAGRAAQLEPAARRTDVRRRRRPGEPLVTLLERAIPNLDAHLGVQQRTQMPQITQNQMDAEERSLSFCSRPSSASSAKSA